MRQKLCKRLEEIEKISAAVASRRTQSNADYEQTFAEFRAEVERAAMDPKNQEWAAQQPPECFVESQKRLMVQMEEMAAKGRRCGEYGRTR